jgi:hypothetical protein
MAQAARSGKLPTGKLAPDKLSTGKLPRRASDRLPVSGLFTLVVLAWWPNSRIGPVMPVPPSDDQPTVCALAHRGFVLMGAPLFRRSETDETPVMVVTLGERQVAVPLRALQREFAIADDAPDGRMLGMIIEALEFVSALRIGDPLPREVCTGEASWEPDAMHLALASMRLRMQLVAWLNAGAAVDAPQMTDEALLRLTDDPAVRRQVQDALDHAASALGLPNREAVVELLEDLAHELAFIEALRDRLLHRVQTMVQKVAHMVQSLRSDAPQMDTLTQVRRLSLLALKQFARKFDELDANTGEVMAALRNAKSQRTFIRSSRDFLYRSLRAWQPILDEWGGAGTDLDDGARELLGRTYQFLAPRYMPVTEWLSPTRPERTKAPVRQMTW